MILSPEKYASPAPCGLGCSCVASTATPKTPGLTIPETLLATDDEVIDRLHVRSIATCLILFSIHVEQNAGLAVIAGVSARAGRALLAFLAVFREGAETVLFITALAATEGGWSAGLFAGLDGFMTSPFDLDEMALDMPNILAVSTMTSGDRLLLC